MTEKKTWADILSAHRAEEKAKHESKRPEVKQPEISEEAKANMRKLLENWKAKKAEAPKEEK